MISETEIEKRPGLLLETVVLEVEFTSKQPTTLPTTRNDQKERISELNASNRDKTLRMFGQFGTVLADLGPLPPKVWK